MVTSHSYYYMSKIIYKINNKKKRTMDKNEREISNLYNFLLGLGFNVMYKHNPYPDSYGIISKVCLIDEDDSVRNLAEYRNTSETLTYFNFDGKYLPEITNHSYRDYLRFLVNKNLKNAGE